jgi:hypothetical protein
VDVDAAPRATGDLRDAIAGIMTCVARLMHFANRFTQLLSGLISTYGEAAERDRCGRLPHRMGMVGGKMPLGDRLRDAG